MRSGSFGSTKELILAPSILAADFSRLGEQVGAAFGAGARYAHIDVMDGRFVPNISVGAPVVKSLRRFGGLTLDVHLMTEEPSRHVAMFAEAGADVISFHVEAESEPLKTIESIKRLGKKAGVVVKPETPVEAAFPFAGLVDMALIMSVEPGFGGRELMPETLNKARVLRDYADGKGLSGLDIEMDGGIHLGNVNRVIESGVNVIVAGTAVFGAEDIAAATKGFIEVFESFER